MGLTCLFSDYSSACPGVKRLVWNLSRKNETQDLVQHKNLELLTPYYDRSVSLSAYHLMGHLRTVLLEWSGFTDCKVLISASILTL